jgi:ubiquitin-protein ligase
MQYYLSEPNYNLNNKLFYILKKKNIKIKESDDTINILLNENQIEFNIYHDKKIPQFVFGDTNEHKYISEIYENINLKIDQFNTIQDIILEIDNKSKSLKNIQSSQEKSKKPIKEFLNEIDGKKEKYIQDNKSNKIINSQLKIFSLRSYVEMLGDQIIKIYEDNRFNVEIINFPNIKIIMNKFNFKKSQDLEITIDMKINLNFINEPPVINIGSNLVLKDNILKVITNLKPFSDISSWSIKYSISNTIINIYNMINTFGEIKQEFSSELDQIINDLQYLVSIKNQNISEIKLLELFDKDLLLNKKPTNNTNNKTTKKNYWKAGTGYGHAGNKEWDIDEYIKKVNEKKNKIGLMYNNFIAKLKLLDFKSIDKNKISKEFLLSIINLLYYYLENEEITNENVISICDFLLKNMIILENEKNKYELVKFDKLLCLCKNYIDENEIIHSLTTTIKSNILNLDINNISSDKIDSFKELFNKDSFVMYNEEFKNFYYKDQVNINQNILSRLKKELNIIKKSITINKDASIFFWIEKNKLEKMRFIITGPINTPYENGLYIFDMTLRKDFPQKPPVVHFSNNGSVRFNPNLYNCGKVCLSLLGTWSGQKGESWNSETSTLFQVLISIQSQILIEEPFFNEPGYESQIGSETGKNNSKKYNDERRQYNLDYAINGLLSGAIGKKSSYPEFDDIIKKYFKFKKDTIITTLNKWEQEYTNKNCKDNFINSKEKFINLVNQL